MNKERENDADQVSDDDLLYRRFHYTSLRLMEVLLMQPTHDLGQPSPTLKSL